MTTHTITSTKTGKVYEVRKMRTEDSFNLPTWHYRRVGDTGWSSMSRWGVETFADAKALVNK